MKKPIISVSGLRGIVDSTLTDPIVQRYAAAFSEECPDGSIVITRDGRPSGSRFAKAVALALQARGREIIYGDVAATPTTGILVRSHNAAGGVQVSASHNPREYNGLKLFGADGRVIPADVGERVLERYRRFNEALPNLDSPTWAEIEDPVTRHVELVLNTVNVERIRKHKFRVVVDSNHGAGSIVSRPLMAALGVDCLFIGDKPDGEFEHQPEPTAENLAGVAARSTGFGADIVFCQDPDADRLAVIDENGRYIGEEYTLAITTEHALKSRDGCVVVNCATSRMTADVAHAAGQQCHIAAVGEANVCNMMIEKNAVYGGEGNGGPIDPEVGYVRDSFVAMAQILDSLSSTDAPISAIADRLPSYSICKTKVSIEGLDINRLFSEIEAGLARGYQANRLDGLRLDWDDRWVLVRPSNTEPIVRVIAEAPSRGDAEELCQLVTEMSIRMNA